MVNPNRLTEARQVRQFNMSQAAQELGTTRQAILRYEQGLATPSIKVLERMKEVYRFPLGFFYKEDCYRLSESAVFFRSLKSADAALRMSVIWKNRWTREAYGFLERFLLLPKLNIPDTDFILRSDEYSFDDIEQLADEVRQFWNAGDGPMGSMIRLLEANGVIVSNGSISNGSVDACSRLIDGKPVIYACYAPDQEVSYFRQNFTYAHELGHLLMHCHLPLDMAVDSVTLTRFDKEANYFASCLLMPRKSFIKDIMSTSLSFLIGLKRKWGVSIAAMIYRCNDLEIITATEYENLNKSISYRRWRKVEPLDDEIPIQVPRLLQKGIKLLLEKSIVSKQEIMTYFEWPESDLEEICALPADYFSGSDPDMVHLQLI